MSAFQDFLDSLPTIPSPEGVKQATCPLCGVAGMTVIASTTQAFCTNDDCPLLAWNTHQTALQILLHLSQSTPLDLERSE